MSIRVMTAVWDHAPFTGGTLLVLLALADWSNDEGVCWPSVPAIAKKSRLTESGTKYALKRLQECGEITWEAGDGRGHTSRYQISSQYLTPFRIKGSVGEDKGVSTSIPNKEEPSLEPSRESGLFSDEITTPEMIVKRVFDYYVVKVGKTVIYSLTPGRMKKGLSRYKELASRLNNDKKKIEESMCMAVDALAADPFFMGKNDRHKQFNDWSDHLFKSEESMEKWLELS